MSILNSKILKKALRENDLSSNFSPSDVQNHRRLSPRKTNTNVKDYLKQNPFLIHSFHTLEQKHNLDENTMNNFNVQMQNIYTLKCEQIIMRIMGGN